MNDSEDLIRQKTEYRKLADGSWQAEFAGKLFRITVIAPTLEQARMDILYEMDARLFDVLCDDLGIPEERRPQPRLTVARREVAENRAQKALGR